MSLGLWMNGRAMLLAALLALAGAVLVFVVTGPRGMTTTWDSACYFQAAHSFAVGDGVLNYSKYGMAEPLIHYPPLYSVALSAGLFFGLDVPLWARILGAFIYGVNIFLAAALVFYLTGQLWALALGGFLTAGFVYFFEIHAAALSEPLFFSFLLAALWVLIRYCEKGGGRLLMIAALFSAACLMTRYAGLAVVLAGAGSILVFGKDRGVMAVRKTCIYLVAALALPVVWLVRNLALTGRPFACDVGVSPKFGEGLVFGLSTLSSYLFPTQIPFSIRGPLTVLFLAALGLVVFVPRWRQRFFNEPDLRMRVGLGCLIVFMAVYALIQVAGMAFSNGLVSLERRLLLPLAVTGIMLIIIGLCRMRYGTWQRVAILLVLIFTAGMFLRTGQLASMFYREGGGANARQWAGSAVAKAARDLPDNIPVYTNDTQTFYLYTGRPSVEIPQAWRDPGTILPLAETRARFMEERAVAVIFNAKRFTPHPLWWELVRSAGLVVVFRDGWGEIYLAPNRR